jgi:hypothetical protein
MTTATHHTGDVFGLSVSSSSTVAPRTKTLHPIKQVDFHRSPYPDTRDTQRTLTNITCGEKFFVRIVALVLNSGSKNGTLGKRGEECRKC